MRALIVLTAILSVTGAEAPKEPAGQQDLAQLASVGAVSVANFGPLHSADDSSTFQKAIDFCIARACVLRVPPGTYDVGGLTVRGATNFEIASDGDLQPVTLKYTGSSGFVLLLSNTRHSTIKGLRFLGPDNRRASTNRIEFVGPHTTAIRIDWDGHSNFNSIGNTVSDCEFQSFWVAIEDGATEHFEGRVVGSPETVFRHNFIHECAYGVKLGGAATLNALFLNHRSQSGVDAIYSHGCNIRVFGATFSNNSNADIELAGPSLSPNFISAVYTEQSAHFLVTGGPTGVPMPTTVTGSFINSADANEVGITFLSPGPLVLEGNSFGNGTLRAPVRVAQNGTGSGILVSEGNVWATADQKPPIEATNMLSERVNDLIYYNSESGMVAKPYVMDYRTAFDSRDAQLRLERPADRPTSEWEVVWAQRRGAKSVPLWTMTNDMLGNRGSWGLYDNTSDHPGFALDSASALHVHRISGDLDDEAPMAHLSPSFGSDAKIKFAEGSNEARGEFTIVCGGRGFAASPTLTLSFARGAFRRLDGRVTRPFVILTRNGGAHPEASPEWKASPDGLLITLPLTPQRGESYTIAYSIQG